MTKYFYDSSAIIYHIGGRASFAKFFTKGTGVTGYSNALEVFFTILKRQGLEAARRILDQLRSIVIDADLGDIEPAMRFRHKYLKRKLSYADALGYTLAQKHRLKFVTSDRQFKKLPGVIFVPA